MNSLGIGLLAVLALGLVFFLRWALTRGKSRAPPAGEEEERAGMEAEARTERMKQRTPREDLREKRKMSAHWGWLWPNCFAST